MARSKIEVLEEDRELPEELERIVALGQALSDPIREWMLGMDSRG